MSSVYNSIFSDGISKHAGLEYESLSNRRVSDRIFKTQRTKSRYVDIVNWQLYGRPTRRRPGEAHSSGSFKESFMKRVVIVGYGMMDAIPKEDIRDDRYGIIHRVLPMQGGALARAFTTNEELVAAELLMNLAFTSSTGLVSQFDGVGLFNTAHPASKANANTTYANRPSVDVNMSIAAADAMYVNMTTQYAPNTTEIVGGPPRKVIFHPTIRRVVTQVYRGQYELDTLSNKNVLKDDNVDLIPWGYFKKSGATGTYNAWFGLGDDHSLSKVIREDFEMDSDDDIVTKSVVWVADHRFEVFWSEWRHSYGCPGA